MLWSKKMGMSFHFEKTFIYTSLKLGDKTVLVVREYSHR